MTSGPGGRGSRVQPWRELVGEAVVDGETVELTPRTLLVIEPGEAHEVRCTGDEPLLSLNLYVPPEY